MAAPIYQTAAFLFDSADHGAALFNLEVEGFRYSRIANPTTEVLEQRVAALKGGVGALAVASGQAASYYAICNSPTAGGEVVCTPQLYGDQRTPCSRMYFRGRELRGGLRRAIAPRTSLRFDRP